MNYNILKNVLSYGVSITFVCFSILFFLSLFCIVAFEAGESQSFCNSNSLNAVFGYLFALYDYVFSYFWITIPILILNIYVFFTSNYANSNWSHLKQNKYNFMFGIVPSVLILLAFFLVLLFSIFIE